MKLNMLLLFLSLSIASIVSAKQPSAISANIVGYTAHELPPIGEHLLIGINLGQIGDRAPSLRSLFGNSNLQAGEQPHLSDQIFIFDAKKNQFLAYAKYSGNNEFYLTSDWLGTPQNPVIPQGSGIFITRATDSTSPREIIISGNVSRGPQTKPDKKSEMILLSSPSPYVNEIKQIVKPYHPHQGDQISIQNKNGAYDHFYLQADGRWKNETEEPLTLKPGQAFWLKREIKHPKNHKAE